MNHLRISFVLLAAVLLAACGDDDNDTPGKQQFQDHGFALVVGQGNYGLTPGRLDIYDMTARTYQEGEAMPGSPQNVAALSGYLFIPVNEEQAVKILDMATRETVGSVFVANAQRVCAGAGYVFAVGGDTLYRINPRTLTVDQKKYAGPGTYNVLVRGSSVYVPIAGTYYGWGDKRNYVDGYRVAKFSAANVAAGVQKEINIGMNAYNQGGIDADGNIILACNGNYSDVGSAIWKIDTGDNSTMITNDAGMALCVSGRSIYCIGSSYDEDWNAVYSYKLLNSSNGALVSESFLAADTELPIAPTFVAVAPGGDIVIGSNNLKSDGSVDYAGNGLLYHYSAAGNFIGKNATAPNPFFAFFFTWKVAV